MYFYGCELGDLHFAIHPFDPNAFVEKVKSKEFSAYEPKDVGFMKMTAFSDPDGNYIEFTQLSDKWFKYLESRRQMALM